jgi:hypothetical protein
MRPAAAGGGAGDWRGRLASGGGGRVKGKERNGEREKRRPPRGPLLGPATPCSMARRCRAKICGPAELGHVTGQRPGRCHGGSLAAPPCMAR